MSRKPIVPKDLDPAYPVTIPEDEIRTKLIELLGLDEIPKHIDFDVDSTEDSEGIRLTHLIYSNALSERVPGILMEPTGSEESLPGVVCISGTGGSAERLAHPEFHLSAEGPLVGWGRELARRGFVTLGISAKGTVGRRSSIEEWALEQKHLAPYGRTQMGILVEETLRAARLLAERDSVDSNRIGLTGMSLGGNAAWYAMACAPWISVGVPVCGGVGSLASVIHKGDPERHSAYYYIPGMLRFFDHAQAVAACMPPRPFMMISPSEDEDMPKEGVDSLIPTVRSAYIQSGHPDRFVVHQPEGNHRFLPHYFEWMTDWFHVYL